MQSSDDDVVCLENLEPNYENLDQEVVCVDIVGPNDDNPDQVASFDIVGPNDDNPDQEVICLDIKNQMKNRYP